jgi:hypothetical protein
MTKAQIDALAQLEDSLLLCKRSGLVLVGIGSDLLATVADSAFKAEWQKSSSCEAVLNRSNNDHKGTVHVETHRVYLDSGGA